MTEPKTSETRCAEYELEIAIKADRDAVWKALVDETNSWWLPDFHMIGESSVVEFDVSPGGRGLIEHREDGSFLVWYSVQFFLPEHFQIYLVGNVAPNWGGPSTSNLFLAVEENPAGCILRVKDAHHGAFHDDFIQSLKNGWIQLFGEGLLRYVEEKKK